MKSWIVTGGIGCGKSAVSGLFKKHLSIGDGAFFSADREVQSLLDTPEVMERLRSRLGPGSLQLQDGRDIVNRAWLRADVFQNQERRKVLEEILHPGVLKALETGRSAQREGGANLFLAEVPLHYEIGGTVSADLIIVVAASPEVQKRRLMERRGLDESIIEQMLRAQWPIAAKVERADVVIWNDGDLSALENQVLTLARQHWLA